MERKKKYQVLETRHLTGRHLIGTLQTGRSAKKKRALARPNLRNAFPHQAFSIDPRPEVTISLDKLRYLRPYITAVALLLSGIPTFKQCRSYHWKKLGYGSC